MNPVSLAHVAARFGERAGQSVGIELVGVCTWRGGARAAYSIIHDDVGQVEADGALTHALEQLSRRSLRAGFACVMERIEARTLWPQLASLIGEGHEVINHSWDHQNLVETPDYAMQIDRSQGLAVRRLGVHAPRLFAFPFDAFDDSALQYLRGAGFAGARAGDRGLELAGSADVPVDDFRIRFDTYGPDYSVYDTDVLEGHVQAAISRGAWAVRELHGVADDSWESISIDEYTRHLDRLVALRERAELWIDTPGEVLAYRRRRLEAGVPSLRGNTLAFDVRAGSASVAPGFLSVELRLFGSTGATLSASQDGRELDLSELPNARWRVEVDPFAGPVQLQLRAYTEPTRSFDQGKSLS